MDIMFSFFSSDIMLSIQECGTKRAGGAMIRELIFLKILIASNDGVAFSTPDRFAAVSGCPLATCRHVWDFCISAGILKKDEFGCYNANDWIAEHSELFGTDNATKTRQKRAQNPKASNSSTEPKMAQTTPLKPQQSASNTDQAFYTDKVAVRPNVWLSHAEIADLKKKYSDDDISRMVDYYSDWKLKKGSNVRTSDYQSITRWVYKILTDNPKEPVKDANPFPAWIYGKTE